MGHVKQWLAMAAFRASIGHSDSLEYTKEVAGTHYLSISELNLDYDSLTLYIFCQRSQS